jgi:oligopeptide transport system substrate-binding protein
MKRTFRNASALALSFCMVATLLTGCGSSTTTTASSTDTASKKTITIAESDNAIALDPTLAEDSFSCVIVGNTIEGLYSVTPEGKVELAMAKDVKVSDDGLTWTFTIRDDAKWSNGDPVTADDFVFGIQRIADPAANTGFAFEVESAHIKNAADVTSGKKTLDQLGVTAKDDKTLVIELDTPCAYLDALLSFSAFAPTNRAFFEKEGSNFALTAKDLLYNGPYVVTSFDTGSNTVTLDKNPNYYDAANVDIDELNFQVIGDTQQAIMAYQNGDVDAITLTGDSVAQYKDDAAFQSGLGMFQWYLSFNTTSTGVPNENLRKAIAYAIDRVTLCNNILKDGSIPSNCMVQRGFCYGPDGTDFVDACGTNQYVYDTAKAKEYWEKAKTETDMRSFTLIYEEDNAMIASVAPFVQSAIESALDGFTVELQIMPKKSRIDDMKNLNYQAALHRWGPDYSDPTAIMAMYTTGHASNYTGCSISEFDKLYNEAQTTQAGDAQARWDTLVKAQNILLNSCVMIPLFQTGSCHLVNPKLQNYVEHFTSVPYRFKYMTLDTAA